MIEEIHRDLEYYFNGEIFTLYGKNNNYYATVDAPETIVELLDIVQSRYNIELPMRDLFYWGADTAEMDAIQSGFLVATTRVKSVPCKHYAFRQEDIDWQIWIEDSATPLPRKLVITSKQEVGQPQYSTTMTWNLSPKLSDDLFIFTPHNVAAPGISHNIQEVR